MDKISVFGVSEETFNKKMKRNKTLTKVSNITYTIGTVTLIGGAMLSLKNKSVGIKLIAASNLAISACGMIDHWLQVSYDTISENILYKR